MKRLRPFLLLAAFGVRSAALAAAEAPPPPMNPPAPADSPSSPGVQPADDGGPPPTPLTLPEAQATALRNHPRVAAAQIQALIAGEVVKESQSAYLPSVTGFASGVDAGNENTRILAGGLNNPSIYHRVAGGLAASQLVTDFGHTQNLTAGSKLEAKAELQNAAATREQILLNVDVAYYSALQAQAVLRVASQTVAARQILVNQVTALASRQLRSQLDVSFAQVAFEQARLLLEKAQGDWEGAQASLAAALGYHADGSSAEANRTAATPRWQPVEPPVGTPPPTVDQAIALAMDDRPDLLSLRNQRDAALRFARAENDLSYPTVSLVGTIGDAVEYDSHLPAHYAAGGVLLDVPLFTGGLYAARQHAAAYRAQIADESLRDAEDNAGRDVRVAWLNLRTAGQGLLTTEELLKNAVQADQLAQARYKVGSSSIVELSQAELTRTSAEIGRASARYDVLTARAILDYQMGLLK
jgi:outer membrane protein